MTLYTRYDYRRLSGDMDSLDADVDDALVTAQQELEEFLDRPLEQLQRTETVRIHPDGRAYPRAVPIVSISDPPRAVLRDDAVWGLWPQQNPQWDIVYEPFHWQEAGLSLAGGGSDSTMPIASITYIGGYTAATLPRKLRTGLMELARLELLPVFEPATAGIKSASVGDTSVSYAEPPDPGSQKIAVLQELRGFRRRELGY